MSPVLDYASFNLLHFTWILVALMKILSKIVAKCPSCITGQQLKPRTSKLESQQRQENQRTLVLLFHILHFHTCCASTGPEWQFPWNVRDICTSCLQKKKEKARNLKFDCMVQTTAC